MKLIIKVVGQLIHEESNKIFDQNLENRDYMKLGGTEAINEQRVAKARKIFERKEWRNVVRR